MIKSADKRKNHKTLVIIPAAGKGLRMGSGNKLLMPLMGRPILLQAIEAFARSPLVTAIALAVSEETRVYCDKYVRNQPGFEKVIHLIPGGATRQVSVYNALKEATPGFDIVLVHDGARPLVDGVVIEAVVRGALNFGAVVPAVKVKDTIKQVSAHGLITKTPKRENLRAIQTPQAFRADILLAAFEAALSDGFTGTDEASLVERAGHSVRIVDGSDENIKITTPEDILMAEAILNKRTALNHDADHTPAAPSEKNKKG